MSTKITLRTFAHAYNCASLENRYALSCIKVKKVFVFKLSYLNFT